METTTDTTVKDINYKKLFVWYDSYRDDELIYGPYMW